MSAWISLLSTDLVNKIKEEAFLVLEKVGIFQEMEEAYDLLSDYGCVIDIKNYKFYVPRKIAFKAVESAPKEIKMYDRYGEETAVLSGTNVHFDPGSAALNILDYESGEQRRPRLDELPELANLVSQLKNLALQSTSMIPGDVPEEISDSIRLYAALKYSPKPVITGTFRKESFKVMRKMLTAVRGSAEALREKPLAIFDCCPSPPVRWSDLTATAVVDCAKAGIPSEFVSMPLMGATGPVTFVGSLVQHCAEELSGVVLAQAAKEGAPVIYGGSPSVFDMRNGTTPMGAIETMMFDAAYAQIGRTFGLPTHAYMGLSDSRKVDYQGGFETGMGAVLAASAGINMVSGAGMMDFESCQSFEKLVLDNEICGMALHLHKGIAPVGDNLGFDEIAEFAESGDFLKSPLTRKYYRSQQYFPSEVVERSAGGMTTGLTANDRAHQRVEKLLLNSPDVLDAEKASAIEKIMLDEAKSFGMNELKI